MMPRPKIARRESPPPVKTLRKPKRVLPLTVSPSCLMLTPGEGMKQPTRKRAIIKNVKRILFLRLGILNASRNAEKIRKLDHLCLAACGLDLLPRAAGERVRLYGNAHIELTVPEYPDPVSLLVDEAGGRKRRGVHFSAFKTRKLRHVDNREDVAFSGGEAPKLRDAADQRHLPSLETGSGLPTRLLPLLPAPAGLPTAGAFAPSDPLPALAGAGGGLEVMQSYPVLVLHLFLSLRPGFLLPSPADLLDLDQVFDLEDHAPDLGAVLFLD